MDRARLIERLMVTFLDELAEHARAMNGDLLALEGDPGGVGGGDRIKSLYRAVHSLKGASRSVGLEPIEAGCHHLETILDTVRERGSTFAPGHFALFFEAVDAFEEAGHRLREQPDLAGSPLAVLLPRLEAATLGDLAAPGTHADSTPQGNRDAAPDGPPTPADTMTAPPAAGPPAVATRLAASGGAAAAEPAAFENDRGPSTSALVRVPAEKLDTMLARSGELLVARGRVEARAGELVALRESIVRQVEQCRVASKPLRALVARDGGALTRRALDAFERAGEQLSRLEKDLDVLAGRMSADRRHLARSATMLDEEVRRVRMLPFAEACLGLDRVARDVAKAAGKEVELIVEGGDVELDRSALEQLKDPLVHLVRNAVDHGIEAPDRRRQAGKPARARVTVAAALRGTQVEVVVSDDGGGLDREAMRRAAGGRGLAVPAGDDDLADLIFLPGFSTAGRVTSISGRGIGLDVVKDRIESLHGAITVTSEPGRGTRFILAVPLTLTTLRALLVRAGGEVFAVAGAGVQRLVRVRPEATRTVEGRPVLILGGPPLPVAVLAEVLGLRPREAAPAGPLPALVLASGERRVAFVVDELIAEQEIIVKGLGPRIRHVALASGATILASGKVALVLNLAALVRAGLGRRGAASAPTPAPSATPTAAATNSGESVPGVPARRRLIVVDDSVTTRTLEKTILEAAGYEVATAVDGEAGWRLLQERGADLVVSDVEMPRMDGFGLTEAIRKSSRFARLPVVLVSSRAGVGDKARGIEVGADAYIVKGGFDQADLLATIAQLL